MNIKQFILLILFTTIYAQSQSNLADFQDIFNEYQKILAKASASLNDSSYEDLSARRTLKKSETIAENAQKKAENAKKDLLQAQDALNKASLQSIEAKKIIKAYEESPWDDEFIDEAEAALENFDQAQDNYDIYSNAFNEAQQQLEDAQEQLNEAKKNFKIAQEVIRFDEAIKQQLLLIHERDNNDQNLFAQYDQIIDNLKAFQKKISQAEDKAEKADNKKD
ncbi:hypothetical protein TTHERM_00095630 (macronuclear) [Tetrahymena thermophila SB210]|uniref:Uncharacterized protein n=1 Tax=Tetrahymena thermophila (strain SB210) TaxID=312017 RepID=Q234Y6_TETTS|nr:hypothetical protein TTHERM_00095630 [Tetrahymena thermophila SB210]EAR91867.1 hypothetical protein TTHERM_00095630 [Tetrahymena thermophila SB210]|eukprot:XP_001012112.1 hypothetical protein TTHERM_00095630 [Tetrahymena thermophila SB210]